MVHLKAKGGYKKANNYFERLLEKIKLGILDHYGKMGVAALKEATPERTGKTADSWRYDIERSDGTTKLIFSNTNTNRNVNIAIILNYGHGTGWGGYVAGRNYINPAIQPVFDKMADDLWKELTSI